MWSYSWDAIGANCNCHEYNTSSDKNNDACVTFFLLTFERFLGSGAENIGRVNWLH